MLQEAETLKYSIENDDVISLSKARKRLEKIEKQIIELREYEVLVRHYADQRIEIDLDNGVVENYKLFGDLLSKIER